MFLVPISYFMRYKYEPPVSVTCSVITNRVRPVVRHTPLSCGLYYSEVIFRTGMSYNHKHLLLRPVQSWHFALLNCRKITKSKQHVWKISTNIITSTKVSELYIISGNISLQLQVAASPVLSHGKS